VADHRARLAAREAELVRALQGGPIPAGLDGRMIAVTRDALVRKRARQVVKVFPALARDLGPEYQTLFQAFARTTPPHEDGSLADGLAFGTYVARERRLSDGARVQLMVARSTATARRGRLRARRGLFIGAILTRRPRGITVVGRAPGRAPRVFSVTAPRRRSTRS
jgi:hypothetical protein